MVQDYRDFLAEVLISEEDLQRRITEMGEEISNDYQGEEKLLLVCILRGGVMFLTDLMRQIRHPHAIEFMAVSSYGVGKRETSGQTRITLDLVLEILSLRKPKSLSVCTLLDKAERREVYVPVKYTGFVIPNKFVFGYGLDIDDYYRNLPFVGVVDLNRYKPG